MTIYLSIGENETKELREFPNTSLPNELHNWFEMAKMVLKLPNTKVHFIKNEDAKKTANGCLVRIGQLGSAYSEDDYIAFVESDDGIVNDKEIIIHELIHLLGVIHTETNHEFYNNLVYKFYNDIEKLIVVNG